MAPRKFHELRVNLHWKKSTGNVVPFDGTRKICTMSKVEFRMKSKLPVTYEITDQGTIYFPNNESF